MPPGNLAHPRDRFGAMVPLPASGGSTAFCWVCWDKNYTGPTVLGWVPAEVSRPPQRILPRRISTPQQRNQATPAPVLLPPAASERKGIPEQREQRGVAIAKRLKQASSMRDSSGARWTGIAFLMLRNTDIFDQLPAPTGKAAAEPVVFAPAQTDRITTPLADAALQPVATWQLIAPFWQAAVVDRRRIAGRAAGHVAGASSRGAGLGGETGRRSARGWRRCCDTEASGLNVHNGTTAEAWQL